MNIYALCLFLENPQGNQNQRCFGHPCHFAWSCASLMSPTLAFQMSLNASGSFWKLRSTFAVTDIFAPGMMLTSCWWTSLRTFEFVLSSIQIHGGSRQKFEAQGQLGLMICALMFGSTWAGENRAIDLSCDQHDVTQWQNSKLAQQVACFVHCQSYRIWFVIGLWQFVNVCRMNDLQRFPQHTVTLHVVLWCPALMLRYQLQSCREHPEVPHLASIWPQSFWQKTFL